MPKLIYTPKAKEDLQGIKAYITANFGADKARMAMKKITTTIRQLELFPEEGPSLQNLIECLTDYRYLFICPNYVFFRIENDTIRIIRVLNENQDFMQILFGISSISEEAEKYWDDTEKNM